MNRHEPRAWLWSMVGGVIAAAAFFAVAEVVALVASPGGGPFVAVGGVVIDVIPRPLKEIAISVFGEFDKIALLVGLGLAALVSAALAGLLQYRRRPLGVAVLTAAGTLTLAASVTRPGASSLAWLPSAAGAVVGAVVLMLLISRLRAWADSDASAAAPENPAEPRARAFIDRRSFFRATAIVGASAVIVGVSARIVSAATSSVSALREELRLPTPGRRVAIPGGADLDIDGLSPIVTANDDFYRVDTALVVPEVDSSTWTLSITGMVDEPVQLDLRDLFDMGLDEYAITLTCVSNEVGGDLVGNAVWLGVPVRDVLAKARPQEGADMVLSRSVDGFTASTPLESLTDTALDAIIAVGMNGEPLPLEHGFPVRMVVPGLYGYVSATKWLTELKVTTFAEDEAYWTPRGYSAKAPIKLSSRIDTPRPGTPVAPGRVPIAGMAWAQTVGIDRVEVSIDDGAWQSATLSNPINRDTWVQWTLAWDATPGTHYVAVRAVDKDGRRQIEEKAPIYPNGSSGWQRLLVTVADD
ncbi:molybdopterin-dependent oxidoreductase [Microbacterium halotolerans]|uniref:molybdopterin-dependent oxidoreductase n=1 Tax=Microbacterium halotolerans TaxID=246613 RepID=UPI000E6AD97E|nr:molybdopterin-dependent oxidoreductase [Microbacterium halotolerans]